MPLPLLLALLGAVSLGALKWLPAPWIWIALATVVACIIAMRSSVKTGARMVWLNLGVVAATLGAFEVWAQLSRLAAPESTTTFAPRSHYQADEILGLSARPGAVVRATKKAGDHVVYEVTYTIGPDGLRVVPSRGNDPPEACVVFFGDSITFGEGLNDDQSLPWVLGQLGSGRFAVYNFSFHGYGPHHMLAALERERVTSIVTCRPTHVIYTGIRDHVARIVALNEWGGRDPRYVLEPDGSVRHTGRFDDQPDRSARRESRVYAQLAKSALVRWATQRHRRVNEDDRRLFVAIVSQARTFVEHNWPGCEFEVLLWNGTSVETAGATGEVGERPSDIVPALTRAGFTPRIVETILPSYATDSASYYIPGDGHPSAKANAFLARYIVEEIIEPRRRP